MTTAGYTVPTVEALKKISSANRVEGMILWVLGAANESGVSYIYRAGATLPGDDVNVVVPDDSVGRWILSSGQNLGGLKDVNIDGVGTNDILRYYNGEWRNLRPQQATASQYGTVILGPGFGLNNQGVLTSILSIRRIDASSYMLTEQDSGCLLIFASSTVTITVPNHSSFPSLIGTQVSLMSTADYAISFAFESGVTLRSNSLVVSNSIAYSLSFLLKLDENEWLIGGETA